MTLLNFNMSKTRRKIKLLNSNMLKTLCKLTFQNCNMSKTRRKITLLNSNRSKTRRKITFLNSQMSKTRRKISFLGVSWSHWVTKARKCSKRCFWGLPGAIWWPRHENVQNEPSGGLLGPFGGVGTKMLKMSLLKASWGRLVTKTRKCSK